MESMADDEINEHNLRHLAQCDDRVTLSAMVQAHHIEAAAWAVAEIDRLRQQLADVTAELESARAAASAEATFADEMLAERDRLLAELLQQPPTLEWLRETLGDSNDDKAADAAGMWRLREPTRIEWTVQNGNTIIWNAGHASVILTPCPKDGEWLLRTRAAVLAAVAETKGAK